jgi:hypothetical protein
MSLDEPRRGPPQICQGCGCDDDQPCILLGGKRCTWVAPGWCSACADPDDVVFDEGPDFTYDGKSGLYLPQGSR